MSIEPVIVTVAISKPPSEAFDAFTTKIADWWPLQTHSIGPFIGEAVPTTVVVEGYEGGRIFEVSPEGIERNWGTITHWAEGEALEFTWHPGDPENRSTHVRVSFAKTDTGGTVLTLVHSGWEVLGEKGKPTRDGYNSGWAENLRVNYSKFLDGVAAA
ncbi:MAG: SRPBCC domain-containing protein [Pseudomonadota bacterium]